MRHGSPGSRLLHRRDQVSDMSKCQSWRRLSMGFFAEGGLIGELIETVDVEVIPTDVCQDRCCGR